MLETALYVSRSNLEPAVAQDIVAQIVAVSRRRNQKAGITGGLIFTGRFFAQVLEGTPDALHRLLATIAADDRHEAMQLLYKKQIASRFFFDWSMAYNGPSRTVEGRIAPLVERDLSGLDQQLSTQALSMLMKEFALLRAAA
jgi:hypothetical protein